MTSLSPAQIADTRQALAAHSSRVAAAGALGIPVTTLKSRVNILNRIDAQAGSSKPQVPQAMPTEPSAAPVAQAAAETPIEDGLQVTPEMALQARIKTLEGVVKAYRKEALDTRAVRDVVFQLAESKLELPEWLVAQPGTSTHRLTGVPTLLASDWHWGEVVNPAEIGGVNEFDPEIARRRAHTLIEGTVELLTRHMVAPSYPGIVFALGGDMVSGNIHDELAETNDKPIMPVVLDLLGYLIKAIDRLKAVFKHVFVPAVSGNHSRIHHKVRSKQYNWSSFDWLLYQILDKHYENDPDVVFFIPDGPDALYSVYGHKYLLTHGNQFRAGDSMIGPLGPIIRGDHKKRSRNAQVEQEYDTLLLGHFHSLMQTSRVITNGSLVGYSEYAYSNNFGYEPPQQALWVTHPTRGITFSIPVHLDSTPNKKKADTPWLSFFDAKRAA